VLALCTRFPLVEGLHLGAVPMNDALAFFGSGLLPFTHLTALSFDVLEHTHTLLAGIHTMFPALLTLDIAAADFRHKPSASLVVTHPALTRLSLRAGHASAGTTGTGTAAQAAQISYGDRLTLRCPLLTELTLCAMEHTRLDLQTPALTRLTIPKHKLASGVQLREALTGLPLLVHLDVSRSPVTTNETLRNLDGSCPDLVELNVSGCPNVTLEGVAFANLRKLDASECSSANLCQAALRAFSALEELLLDESGLPTLDLTTLRRLKVVSLNRCRLTSLRVWSPELVDLRLAECHALVSVDVRSAAAKSFEWRHLIELATVQLVCPNLEYLVLEDCDALKPEECTALTGVGRCKLNSVYP
jgi:hypothetical protein